MDGGRAIPEVVEALPLIARTFGVVGAVLILLCAILLGACGVILHYYRRDFHRDAEREREHHERRDKREDRLITALEAVSETRGLVAVQGTNVTRAIEQLGDTLRRSEQQRSDDMMTIIRTIRDIEPGIVRAIRETPP